MEPLASCAASSRLREPEGVCTSSNGWLFFMEYMRDTAALVLHHQTPAHNGAFAPTKPARVGAKET